MIVPSCARARDPSRFDGVGICHRIAASGADRRKQEDGVSSLQKPQKNPKSLSRLADCHSGKALAEQVNMALDKAYEGFRAFTTCSLLEHPSEIRHERSLRFRWIVGLFNRGGKQKQQGLLGNGKFEGQVHELVINRHRFSPLSSKVFAAYQAFAQAQGASA